MAQFFYYLGVSDRKAWGLYFVPAESKSFACWVVRCQSFTFSDVWMRDNCYMLMVYSTHWLVDYALMKWMTHPTNLGMVSQSWVIDIDGVTHKYIIHPILLVIKVT